MKDYFGDEWPVPDPYIYDLFRETGVVHLAQRLFIECVRDRVDVPEDIMTCIITEMEKQVEKYDVDHPEWYHRHSPSFEQAFIFHDIKRDLEKAAENGGRAVATATATASSTVLQHSTATATRSRASCSIKMLPFGSTFRLKEKLCLHGAVTHHRRLLTKSCIV